MRVRGSGASCLASGGTAIHSKYLLSLLVLTLENYGYNYGHSTGGRMTREGKGGQVVAPLPSEEIGSDSAVSEAAPE